MIAAAFIGQPVDGGVYALGYIPLESLNGDILRAVRVCVAETLRPSQDYWVLRIGTLVGTTFTARTEVNLRDGIVAGEKRWAFASDIRVPRGSLIALKAVKVGNPPAILGLSLILEYGILGARGN